MLAPTILVFAIANPLSWLLTSIGLVGRNLKAALVIAPAMIAGYVMGLSHGPNGVAFAYSAVLTLCLLPLIAWCVHGTVISFWDILLAVSRPLGSSIVAGGGAVAVHFILVRLLSPLPRLILESTVLLVAYFGILLFVTGQKALYVDLLRGLRGRPPVEEKSLASA